MKHIQVWHFLHEIPETCHILTAVVGVDSKVGLTTVTPSVQRATVNA